MNAPAEGIRCKWCFCLRNTLRKTLSPQLGVLFSVLPTQAIEVGVPFRYFPEAEVAPVRVGTDALPDASAMLDGLRSSRLRVAYVPHRLWRSRPIP